MLSHVRSLLELKLNLFQGFRSSSGPNAGLLDPEFEAFQAGQAPLLYPEHQHFAAGPSNFQRPLQHGQAGPSAWTDDFQRMSIHQASPTALSQPLHESQLNQRGDIGGWHQDFVRHQGQPTAHANVHPGVITSAFPHHATQPNFTSMSYQSFNQPMGMSQSYQQPQAIHQEQAEVFDEEAFARAFDDAAQSEIQVNDQLQEEQNVELDQEVATHESVEPLIATDRLGADLIHDPLNDEQQDRQAQEDPDALARTAAQLLDSVKHDTSSKFANSQFLELMRQLRDKEVMVEGDKIVDRAGNEVESGQKDTVEVHNF
jgi:hypothetical protein